MRTDHVFTCGHCGTVAEKNESIKERERENIERIALIYIYIYIYIDPNSPEKHHIQY